MTYKVDRLPKAPDGTARRFVDLTVNDLTEEKPEVALGVGDLGVVRLINLTPQPIGAHFSVVWNGDVHSPRLLFDGWPSGPVSVRVEVTGR